MRWEQSCPVVVPSSVKASLLTARRGGGNRSRARFD